ncbi:MAG: DNA repair protein RecO [Chloroflexi bacterium]|nr:DNA repair protein RecO [Chloroflexota bacterium]
MPAPRVYKAEGIVLKGRELGEADRIVTLLTPTYGKLRAVAKGVRKPRSRLAGHLEPLTRVAILVAHGQSLDIIAQAQTIESFRPLREDLWRASCGLYLAELVDRFTVEGAESEPVYKLLLETLTRLALALPAKEGRESRPAGMSAAAGLLRSFEVELLDHLGYRPELGQCIACRRALEPVENYFSSSAGGMACPACRYQVGRTRPVTVDALKVLRLLQRRDATTLGRLRLGRELASELELLLREYIAYILERDVHSTAFLDRLRREEAASSRG